MNFLYIESEFIDEVYFINWVNNDCAKLLASSDNRVVGYMYRNWENVFEIEWLK